MQTIFGDRRQAGDLLAEALRGLKGEDMVVLGIPRGGVVVASRVAEALGATLDIVVTKKIGAPEEPEFAVGAVTQEGEAVLNEEVVKLLGIRESYLKSEAERLTAEIRRRMVELRSTRPYPSLRGKTVVIVDDGVATGSTVSAAIKSVRKQSPSSVIVAVPVAPPEAVQELSKEADKVVCLETPDPFFAIGQFYDDFAQADDEQVKAILAGAPGSPS